MVVSVDKLCEVGKQIGTYNPFEIAEYLNIDIVFTEDLPDSLMGLAVSELKVAFITNRFRDHFFSHFLCAHELVHNISHDGIQAYYNTNERAKSKLENEADKGAVRLLVNYFLELFPDLDYFRPDLIINYFDLPRYLFGKVEKEMKYLVIEQLDI